MHTRQTPASTPRLTRNITTILTGNCKLQILPYRSSLSVLTGRHAGLSVFRTASVDFALGNFKSIFWCTGAKLLIWPCAMTKQNEAEYSTKCSYALGYMIVPGFTSRMGVWLLGQCWTLQDYVGINSPSCVIVPGPTAQAESFYDSSSEYLVEI